MMDSKCTLRNAKVCAFLHKCVYSDNFDQPICTTQNPNEYMYLCTSFKFYLDFQRRHDFFSKSVADLVHAIASFRIGVPSMLFLLKLGQKSFGKKLYTFLLITSFDFSLLLLLLDLFLQWNEMNWESSWQRKYCRQVNLLFK